MKNKNILIVCAHIDDETFGMGGSIYDLSKNNNVKILSVCKGLVVSRMKEREKAIKEYENLGIQVQILNNLDLTLENLNIRDIINQIEKIVKDFKTDIIFTHSKDSNPDHNIVSDAVDVICRLKNNIEKLYHFSIPGNAEWSRSNFQPNIYKWISDEASIFKYKMVKKYNSLLDYKTPNPLSFEKIQAKDNYIGSIANCDKAESFQLVLSKTF